MEHYTHLDMKERFLINHYLSIKTNVQTIAEKSKRHRSTIYRELKRNTQHGCYLPSIAHGLAKKRQSCSKNKIQTNEKLNRYVLQGLKKGWTPEQISGRMKQQQTEFYVCSESIYRYIYRYKHLGLYKLLPGRRPKRLHRSNRKISKWKLRLLARHIDHRETEANSRKVMGHWEGDTIRFPNSQKTCVTTLVERKSRFVCLRKNDNKNSETVMSHIVEAIKSSPKKIWSSLAFDQGTEFMDYHKIEQHTKCKVYFCDPHSPWQRGSNENMNGRLRRYLPKNFEIDKIGQTELNKIAIQANDTPRKCLGYYTPNEVITQHWKTFCRTSL